mmetsp:Transcript_14112/g.33452  ORF Transcript_14112/g.33452 Transcript_14112/m.33452 type:complete len:175 (-) Transcript_14112:288-812(-)
MGSHGGPLAPFDLLGPETRLLEEAQLRQMSPVQLAFIGDSVYELHARTLLAWPVTRPHDHRTACVEMVRAETQSRLLRRLVSNSGEEGRWALTPDERRLLKKGRNAAGPGPPRLEDKGAYGEASALETLLGYLYLSDRPRLQTLMDELLVLGADTTEHDEDFTVIDWKAGDADL